MDLERKLGLAHAFADEKPKKRQRRPPSNTLKGRDEFEEFRLTDRQREFNSLSTLEDERFSMTGGLTQKRLIRPNIPKPPAMTGAASKKQFVAGTDPHIKRILLDCNVVRTRSKKVEGPEGGSRTELYTTQESM